MTLLSADGVELHTWTWIEERGGGGGCTSCDNITNLIFYNKNWGHHWKEDESWLLSMSIVTLDFVVGVGGEHAHFFCFLRVGSAVCLRG